MITQRERTGNKGGIDSRPSMADEAWELYRLAQGYGDEATMRIAMRDIEIARELERDPAEEIVTPLDHYGLPGCRYSTEEHNRIASHPVSPRFGHTMPSTPCKWERASRVDYPGTVSTKEYAAMKGVTVQTVRKWIKAGDIQAIRTGDNCGTNQWRIRVEEAA